MKDSVLRECLAELLEGAHAHVSPDQALAGIKPETRNARPAGHNHTIWEQLEHLRIAQEDILRYAIDPSWRSPAFPEDYWPAPTSVASDEDWETSCSSFFSDLREVIALARDPRFDLTAAIPHGIDGHTYLREIVLVADHNAYHLGQIVQTRKALGDWPG